MDGNFTKRESYFIKEHKFWHKEFLLRFLKYTIGLCSTDKRGKVVLTYCFGGKLEGITVRQVSTTSMSTASVVRNGS